ncbi:uncharacterized protein C9orf85 homolog [Tubulanus polymorphus]|uniref:uncharacterized protein C9orf85 homolog n=1 Tax=Tubulanus polymorphus TaxID=672921 RepID=UPI003DA60A3C
MSSQKGNSKRTRGQKYQNKSAFKNNLHDTSKMTKLLNELAVTGVCKHCSEIIDWKIKYKKYKPLTQAKKCTKCLQKTVKKAYYIICEPCAKKHEVCAKCGKNEEIVQEPLPSEAEEARMQSQFEQELKLLPERKRKTFLRLQASGKLTGENLKTTEQENTDLCQSSDSSDEDENSDDRIEQSICEAENVIVEGQETFNGGEPISGGQGAETVCGRGADTVSE